MISVRWNLEKYIMLISNSQNRARRDSTCHAHAWSFRSPNQDRVFHN